jgi:hypothetical protein
VPGLLLAGLGALIVFVDFKAAGESEARKAWPTTGGMLGEIGIRYTSGVKTRSSYSVIARFTLRVGGKEYAGRAISGGGSSRSLAKVASVVSLYAPEAASLTSDDFGWLRPERLWPVVLREVPVRYDRNDPSRCEAVLGPPLRDSDQTPAWLPRLVALILIGLGSFTVILSRYVSEEPAQRPAPPGPPLRSAVYSEERRAGLLGAIGRLKEEVGRVRAESGLGDDQNHFAEAVDELAAAARDGTLVPAEQDAYGYGRWADEVFQDDRLCAAASAVGACLRDMAQIRVLAGPVRPGARVERA